MKEDDRIEKLWRFLAAHESCGDEVLAATDVVPEVIRLDCMKCGANVQVRRKP